MYFYPCNEDLTLMITITLYNYLLVTLCQESFMKENVRGFHESGAFVNIFSFNT